MQAPNAAPVRSSYARAFDGLEDVRMRLVRAQEDENAAIRRLSDVTSRPRMNKALFAEAFAHAHAARERAIAAYEQWKEAMRRLRQDASERSDARADAVPPVVRTRPDDAMGGGSMSARALPLQLAGSSAL